MNVHGCMHARTHTLTEEGYSAALMWQNGDIISFLGCTDGKNDDIMFIKIWHRHSNWKTCSRIKMRLHYFIASPLSLLLVGEGLYYSNGLCQKFG